MRLIRTLVSPSNRQAVLSVLDEQGVDYVVTEDEESPNDGVVVEFPLPTQAVDLILDELRDVGHEDDYTVVTSAESALAQNFDDLESRFVRGDEEDESIAVEEIRSTAIDMTPSPLTYYSMTVLSALVATAGILLDSPAVVVGSMVIAPLVGSAVTASVGTVIGEAGLVVDGFYDQVRGLVVAIASAALFGFFLKSAAFLPPALDVTTIHQLATRISPGLLAVVVGVGAGAAGAFAVATSFSVTLVGVMIAAALIPAAATVGIAIAWGLPAVGLGAALLLLTNIVAIHVACVAVLWYFGYRPDDRESTTYAVTVGAVLVLGLVFLVAGAAVSTHVVFERTVNDATTEVLDAEEYEELSLVSVRTEFDGSPLLPAESTQNLTVVVSRPVDEPYPELANRLDRRVTTRTGREVTVVVEFVERQRSDDVTRRAGV